MRPTAHIRSGVFTGALLALFFGLGTAAATEITIKRKLSSEETLQSASGEHIEINFTDGSLLIVGSNSRAQLETSDGALPRLELVSGVFEIGTATGGAMNFRTGACSVDLINGVLRAAVGAQSTFFMFQSGSAVLIRSDAGVTNLTEAGLGVDVACGGDGTASDARPVRADEVAAIEQMLGPPDAITAIDLIKNGRKGRGQKNFSIKAPLDDLITPIVSVAPDATLGSDILPPLPLSVAPGFQHQDDGLFEGPEIGYEWENPGGRSGGAPGPSGSSPFRLDFLQPSGTPTGTFPSTVFDTTIPDSTQDIRFIIDPAARAASPIPSALPEHLDLGVFGSVPLGQTEDPGLTRLSIDGTNKSYVTFTYRNTRFALLAGTHSASGELVTSPLDAGFDLHAFETFRLTPGQVQVLSGFANGIGVETDGSAYVGITSADLSVHPASSAFSPMGPGVAGSVGLAVNGVSATSLSLFGSAKADDSHYFDLASQASGSTQISMASGEVVPDLKVPASVPKYGSYLDWGIIRGRVTAGGKTADLLPTPWVAGREWSPSDLDGFKGTAVYQGHALGNVIDPSGARSAFGSYTNSWDFAAGTGTVAMDFDGARYAGTTARRAGTIAFTGDLSAGARTGDVSGKFYGNSRAAVAPDALGGAFTIRGTLAEPYAANGIFAAGKQ